MKQKIKKLVYTIALDNQPNDESSIVISKINSPKKECKKHSMISISFCPNDKKDSDTRCEIIIPKKKVKELRKALKQAYKD
ncbi:hypothetical protein [Helicobacter canadensis]|uniref:Uncharacterized protein n=1 Tax=Helicobacter canadensis MIT 98-5491 TaxID=537970 RepID=C5ZVJ9_9HELI|nr:hypothetical protein [Helicobacter canadensis]EES88896.1 hypothetical protein HCAN_0175 [Helicobacter canadensis MIT 98-5491]EFR48796.1 hypothetical protein HCMG_00969 [Helicobacter canadensis MIT 98-5491]STP00166.1 Uncharacterised protein [Helicobacter canadensis]